MSIRTKVRRSEIKTKQKKIRKSDFINMKAVLYDLRWPLRSFYVFVFIILDFYHNLFTNALGRREKKIKSRSYRVFLLDVEETTS